MGNYLLPIPFPRAANWRLHQAEVAPRVVRADVEEVTVVVWVILDVLLSRLDGLPRGRRLVCGDVSRLTGCVTCRYQEYVTLAARLERLHPEAFVLLLINQIVWAGAADGVPVQAIMALGCIFYRIENCLVVIRPNH